MLNFEQAKVIMERENADWLIATTPENVLYAANFHSLGQWLMRSSKIEVLVLIPRHDPRQSILISPAQELDVAAAVPPQVAQIHTIGYTTIEPGDTSLWEAADKRLAKMIYDSPSYTSVYDAIEKLGIFQAGQRIILDDNLTYDGLERILPANAELLVVPEVMYDIRVIKNQREIELLREGTRIAEEGLKASLAALRTGITEKELARIYDQVLIEAGTIPYMTIVGIGSNGASPNHPPVDRALRPNEMIRWDTGCEIEGYRVDMGFVAFYGEPSEKVLKYMDAIQRGQTACFNAIRPGNTLDEVYWAGFNIMKEVIPSYNRKHLGHGVGIELREAPIVAPNDGHKEKGVYFKSADEETAGIIKQGMIISLEVLYYELGLGGFQIEDTIVVTEDGAERFNKLPYELTIVPVKNT